MHATKPKSHVNRNGQNALLSAQPPMGYLRCWRHMAPDQSHQPAWLAVNGRRHGEYNTLIEDTAMKPFTIM